MTDLDAIQARAAIRPGAFITALRCIPDGEIRHGCVISDGAQTKGALRAAWELIYRDVPTLLAEVRELRQQLAALQDGGRRTCPVCGERFTVTKAGKMRSHSGDVYQGGWRQQCEGTGQLPSEAVTYPGGET